MEKIIEIDLNNKSDFIDKYNEKKISEELIHHIIKQSIYTKRNEQIKIIINKKCEINKDCVKMIKEGLKEECNRSIEARNRDNMKQITFILLGMLMIFLSTLIEERGFWKEILIISGWVPIWETIEIELFPDIQGRKKRKTIKKLLNSEIVEKTIKD